MNALRSLALALLALGGSLGQAPAQAVQMKSGTVLLGDAREGTEEGFTLQRFDNGGVLQLKWEDLSPSSAQELKQHFHLTGEEEVEVMVDADVITIEIAGGRLEEVVGVIVQRNPKDLVMRTKTMPQLQIPLDTIRGARTRSVKAVDLYTKDELYNRKLQEIAPGEDADKHVQLANLLISVRDYERAKQHFEQARNLGNSKQPALIEKKLARLALMAESAAEQGLLDDIQTAANRKEFARANELIQKYQTSYSQAGKLKAEFEVTKGKVDKARERWLIARVAELWYIEIRHAADHKIADRTVTYAQAKTYGETQMGKDIRATIVKALGGLVKNEDEVKQKWDKRFEVPTVLRASIYSYHLGSWLLSADGVLAGTKQGEVEAKDAEKNKPVDQDTERLLKKIKDARERAKKAGQSDQQQQTEEDWWKEAKPEIRSQWLQAYYVEKGGDLKLVRAMVEPCIECGGEGTITEIGTGGQPQKLKCFVCHGVRFTRRVRAQ